MVAATEFAVVLPPVDTLDHISVIFPDPYPLGEDVSFGAVTFAPPLLPLPPNITSALVGGVVSNGRRQIFFAGDTFGDPSMYSIRVNSVNEQNNDCVNVTRTSGA